MREAEACRREEMRRCTTTNHNEGGVSREGLASSYTRSKDVLTRCGPTRRHGTPRPVSALAPRANGVPAAEAEDESGAPTWSAAARRRPSCTWAAAAAATRLKKPAASESEKLAEVRDDVSHKDLAA